MSAPVSATDAGRRLRAVRERMRLSMREVEELSSEIAGQMNGRQYFISRTWLAEIESGSFKLNIYKLQSLSLIYRMGVDELLSFFGVGVRSRDAGMLAGLPHTYLLPTAFDSSRNRVVVPLKLRPEVDLGSTNLASRMFENWGQVPLPLLQQMAIPDAMYGYVGLKDCMLYPHLRPGSFVQIDSRQTRIQLGGWPDEYKRPIYFVELRDRYVCSWCEQKNNRLVLLPSGHAGQPTTSVRYPEEADILGRVTAVTMTIAELNQG